ncbi:unnamed protein product [Closterium sp. NIES-65]|nr:unnamed protein product [Closterium sp. NIES-65]
MAAVQVVATVAISDPRVAISSPIVQPRRISRSLAAFNPSLRLLSSNLSHAHRPSRRDRTSRQHAVVASRSVPLRAEPRAGHPTVQSSSSPNAQKSVRASAVAAPKAGVQSSTSAAADARSAAVGGSGAGRAAEAETSAVVLLDVREMMCGGCAAAVRQVLSEHPRVISAGVNLVTESAAVTVSLRAPEASASPSASASAAPSATASFPPAIAKAGDEAAELEALRAELAELVEDAGFPCSVRRAGEADEEGRDGRSSVSLSPFACPPPSSLLHRLPSLSPPQPPATSPTSGGAAEGGGGAEAARSGACARGRAPAFHASPPSAPSCLGTPSPTHPATSPTSGGTAQGGGGAEAARSGARARGRPWMAVLDDVRARSAIAAVALLLRRLNIALLICTSLYLCVCPISPLPGPWMAVLDNMRARSAIAAVTLLLLKHIPQARIPLSACLRSPPLPLVCSPSSTPGPWMAVLDDVRARSAIAAVALLGPARDLLVDGMKALLRGSPNMNSLVGLASLAAFFIGVAAQLYPDLGLDSSFTDEPVSGHGTCTGVMLLAVVLLGRSLEASARAQASSDLNALMSLLPSTARLLVQDDSTGGSEQGGGGEAGGSTNGLLASLSASGVGSGGLSEGAGGGVESGSEEEGGEGLALSMAAWVQVPANHVRPGDRVLVLPGDVIPVDGVVESGRSAVDESLQTGEAATVPKRRGATVAAGTVNWEGPIVVSATATGASCAVCEMARRVEDAQQRTAPVQRLADAIAGPFVFTIMSLSAATFAFWYTVGVHLYPAVLLSDFAGDDSDPLVLSLRLAISVLVVACPCALGLATPTAILVGTSLGARRGLLLRGGDVLERLAAVDVVAFDKTGTLTAGQPQVSAVVPAAHLPPTTLHHSQSHSTSLNRDPATASSRRHTTTTATAVATDSDTATDTATVSLLQLAAAAEATTRHPVAAAITAHAARLSAAPLPPVSSALTVPGRGVVAVVDGREIHVGGFDWVVKHCLGGTREREGRGGSGKGSEVEGEREKWRRVEEGVLRGECGGVGGSVEGGDWGSRDSSSSHTFVYVGEVRSEEERSEGDTGEGGEGERRGAAEEGKSVGGILGCICVSDSLRAEAEETVSRLESLGVSAAVLLGDRQAAVTRVAESKSSVSTFNRLESLGVSASVLSGDRQAAVTRVAEAVGIAGPGKVLGRLLPEGKAEAIESMQRDGHSVAMVGDGINDTLALARADVGVAVPPPGATSAVMSAAADAADLVLLGNRLTQLVEAVHLARATMNRVRLNLAWALAYNCLAVPLAAGAFLPAYDIALTPTLAGTTVMLTS